MQNWEVLQKKISEMSKEEFVGIVEKLGNTYSVLELFNIDLPCKLRDCIKYNIECKECMRVFWEEEYQPSKQERWIVHRTLRRENKEVYVGHRTSTDYDDVKCGYTMIYQKEFATRYEEKEAINVRDELNGHRIGKRYLWVVSKVEE